MSCFENVISMWDIHETIHVQFSSDKRRPLIHSYIHYEYLDTCDLFLCHVAELEQSVIQQQGEHTEESDINRIALKPTLGDINIDSN